jgi:site-specific recombinase XerD
MKNAIKILFYVRKSKTTSDGLTPIYMRVTIDNSRFESATGRPVVESKWSRRANRIEGNSSDAKELNQFLNALRAKAFDIQKTMINSGRSFSIEEFTRMWRNEKDETIMLLDVFAEHNAQVKALVGRQYSVSTCTRYETSLAHTRNFLMQVYNKTDIPVDSLQYRFITDYEFWFKKVRKCNHNSTIKYLTNFKKIVYICIKNGWLSRDPFIGFKMAKHEVDREFLVDKEIENIIAKTFPTPRMNQVRDIFIFCCYTGLAYADVEKLSPREIVCGVDGEQWIWTNRKKTDSPTRIPLLPVPLQILERYKDDPICVSKGKVLPLLSNQKMNAYLKEIADVCGISKNLTFHTARHTFATTVTLTNGVPIETVGKMLGHRNLKTTQHYAKIINKKVADDMKNLKKLLALKAPAIRPKKTRKARQRKTN